jgi:hypothetical protein
MRLLVFAPSHSVQMDFMDPSVRIDEKSEKFSCSLTVQPKREFPMGVTGTGAALEAFERLRDRWLRGSRGILTYTS